LPCTPLPVMFTNMGEAVSWVDQVAAQYVDCDSRRALAVAAWPK